uniref:Uncharacterized protein n=1 Tax=Romanomermis culicivorax TaxID=13658 RepID=A0A915JS04_ROMCU
MQYKNKLTPRKLTTTPSEQNLSLSQVPPLLLKQKKMWTARDSRTIEVEQSLKKLNNADDMQNWESFLNERNTR